MDITPKAIKKMVNKLKHENMAVHQLTNIQFLMSNLKYFSTLVALNSTLIRDNNRLISYSIGLFENMIKQGTKKITVNVILNDEKFKDTINLEDDLKALYQIRDKYHEYSERNKRIESALKDKMTVKKK